MDRKSLDACKRLLKTLMQSGDDSSWFLSPVSPFLQNTKGFLYRDVVKHPMDFGTIRKNLYESKYHSAVKMFRDLKLVFENTSKFNPPNSVVVSAAERLRRKFAHMCVVDLVLSESYTLLDRPKSSDETQVAKPRAKRASPKTVPRAKRASPKTVPRAKRASPKTVPAPTSASKSRAKTSTLPVPSSKKSNSKQHRKLTPAKTKKKSSKTKSKMSKEEYAECSKILDQMVAQRDKISIYMEPVNQSIYKDYAFHVSRAVSVKNIRSRIKTCSQRQFVDDIQTMFTNALCYNYRVVDPLTKIIRTNAMDFIDSFARKYRPYSQIVGATMDQSNRKVCRDVLDEVLSHRMSCQGVKVFAATPFLTDPTQYGHVGYRDKVNRVMYLHKISQTLNNRKMKTPTEFATDMRLTFQNALTYGLAIQVGMVAFSKSGQPMGKTVQVNLLDLAQHLLKFFSKIWARHKQRLKPESRPKIASVVKPKNKSPTKKPVILKSKSKTSTAPEKQQKASTAPEKPHKALSKSTGIQPMQRNLSVPKIQLKIVMSKTLVSSLNKLLKELRFFRINGRLVGTMFGEPVDRKRFPDYYTIVKNPIDISTISTRLHKRMYVHAEAFKAEIYLMFKNCHQYNSGAIVGKEPRYIATRMKEYFDQRFSACCRSLTLSVRNARHLVDYDIVPIVKSASALKRPNAKKTKRPRENVVSPVRMLKVNKKPKKESSSASLAPPRKIAKVSKPSKHTSHIKTVKPKASSNATRKAPSPATVSAKKSLASKSSPTKPEKAKSKHSPTKLIIKNSKKETKPSTSKHVVSLCLSATCVAEQPFLLPNTTQSPSKISFGKTTPHQSPNKKPAVVTPKKLIPKKSTPKKSTPKKSTPKKTDKKPKHSSNSSKKAAKNTAAKKQRNLMQKLCPGEKIFAKLIKTLNGRCMNVVKTGQLRFASFMTLDPNFAQSAHYKQAVKEPAIDLATVQSRLEQRQYSTVKKAVASGSQPTKTSAGNTKTTASATATAVTAAVTAAAATATTTTPASVATTTTAVTPSAKTTVATTTTATTVVTTTTTATSATTTTNATIAATTTTTATSVATATATTGTTVASSSNTTVVKTQAVPAPVIRVVERSNFDTFKADVCRIFTNAIQYNWSEEIETFKLRTFAEYLLEYTRAWLEEFEAKTFLKLGEEPEELVQKRAARNLAVADIDFKSAICRPVLVCLGVTNKFSKELNRYQQFFRERVDYEKYNIHDYTAFVSRPMDFSIVKKKSYTANPEYRTYGAFMADVNLVFDNARKYNDPINGGCRKDRNVLKAAEYMSNVVNQVWAERTNEILLKEAWVKLQSRWDMHAKMLIQAKRDFEKKQKLATAVMREQKEEQERLTRIREIELQKIKDKAKQKAQRAIKEYGPQYTKEERILAQNATKRERKKRRAMTFELRRTQDEAAASLIVDLWDRGEFKLSAPAPPPPVPDKSVDSPTPQALHLQKAKEKETSASNTAPAEPYLKPTSVCIRSNRDTSSSSVEVFARLRLRHERTISSRVVVQMVEQATSDAQRCRRVAVRRRRVQVGPGLCLSVLTVLAQVQKPARSLEFALSVNSKPRAKVQRLRKAAKGLGKFLGSVSHRRLRQLLNSQARWQRLGFYWWADAKTQCRGGSEWAEVHIIAPEEHLEIIKN